jgi:hypothetical protein
MIDRQREKFVPYANDAIDALTVISKQYTGKNLARIPVQYRKYTQSYIDSILIGLGKDLRYKSLVDKLKALSVHAISKEKVSKYGLYENVDMAQSDINKIIKYSDSLQSMFSTNDNLDDWIKAKLNHACDYVATVRDYLKFYIDERENIDQLTEEVDNLESKYNKEKIDSIIDGLQHALDIVGLEPTIGSVADGTNAVISLLRSALSKETNEQKKHLLNAAISAVSVIPFGDLAKIIKLRVLRKPAVKLLNHHHTQILYLKSGVINIKEVLIVLMRKDLVKKLIVELEN